MEIILAIVVASAVIFFGALISAGNERQRKAIDGLREQVVLWAMQDLRIKRERLARDVHVDNPLSWLSGIASKACGHELSLQFIEAFENPQVLVCAAGDAGGKVVFASLSPIDIQVMKRAKHNRLSRYAEQNPLLLLPRKVTAFECSVLNNGILFDLELPLAWKSLTGNTFNGRSVMWMYFIS
jgi:hypothetical protein